MSTVQDKVAVVPTAADTSFSLAPVTATSQTFYSFISQNSYMMSRAFLFINLTGVSLVCFLVAQ